MYGGREEMFIEEEGEVLVVSSGFGMVAGAIWKAVFAGTSRPFPFFF